ncbi:MAG: hypothetical protein WKF77_24710 [Planctomycetaceae bacterium]
MSKSLQFCGPKFEIIPSTSGNHIAAKPTSPGNFCDSFESNVRAGQPQYVDLITIRASVTTKPDTSNFTSAQERITTACGTDIQANCIHLTPHLND